MAYIASSYIALSNPASPAPTPKVSAQTGKIVNCTSYVNVRSGPGSSYSKLGTAPKGAVYTVTGSSGSYIKIDYKDRAGYVYSTYISLMPATVPSPSPSPTPAATPTLGPSPSPMPVPATDPVTPTISPAPTPTAAPSPVPSASLNRPLVAGYYASWAAYYGYTPLDIPAGKMTDVLYAFANIGSDLKIAMGDPQIDASNFAKLRQLKQQHPKLRTLISVGGWTWSKRFSDVAFTEQRRSDFSDSVVQFIKQHGFDGVDIDWEYPGRRRDGRQCDKARG